jgi:hypothetical protein
LNDVDPQAWLADVLARIAEHPVWRDNFDENAASIRMRRGRPVS